MSKRFIGLAALVALSLVMAGGLFAQPAAAPLGTLPDLWFTSPTKTATEERFSTDADNYIGVGDYAGVEFENRFMFGAFNGIRGHLGYAQRIGSIYIGAYYGGRLLDGYDALQTKTQDKPNAPGETLLNTNVPAWALTNVATTAGSPINEDRLAVIVGLANMGFRASWASTYRSIDASDVAYTGTLGAYTNPIVSSIEAKKGFMAPQLAWGMTTPLLANGVKPSVTVDFYIYKNSLTYETYAAYPNTTNGEEVGWSRNYMMPKVNVGLGGYDFYTSDALTLGADFGYTFAKALFKSEFDYIDSKGKSAVTTVKGFNDGTNITEQSWTQHIIEPSVNVSYNAAPNLALKANLKVPVTITLTKADVVTPKGNNGDLEQNGNANKNTEIVLAPVIQLGMQYRVISDKLFLNIGGQFQPASVTWETDKGETYLAGKAVDNTSTTTKTRAHDTGNASVSLGLTWNITENIALDAMTGLENGTNLNVFGDNTTGNTITYFGSIMASLKF